MKQVGSTDITLSDKDKEIIDEITKIQYFDIRKLIKFTNMLLLNQQTILEAAVKDRDYIEKSRKLRDEIINLNKLIVSDEDVETLLQHLLFIAIDIVPECDAGIVLQTTDKPHTLKLAAYSGFDLTDFEEKDFHLKDTYLYVMGKLESSKPLVIRDKRKIDEKYHTSDELERYEKTGYYKYPSVLTAPIIIDGKLYGILSLNSSKKDGFSDDDIHLMEYFTSEMGVVIKNSMLIKKAFFLSRYDSLTGINNRHFFEDVVKLTFQDAHRYNRSLHIVLFDLDDFKEINDTFGHEAGDKVLKVFADTVGSSIRESDIFARYGGDEFVALFHDSNQKNLKIRLQAIIDRLSRTPVHIGEIEYFIKYSFGIAGYPEDAENYEDLLRIADKNMYHNKAENKKNLQEI